MTEVSGGCHCGAVRFTAKMPDPPVHALDCNCSICSMTGFLHVMVPHEDFELVTGRDSLATYGSVPARRNTSSVRIAG